MKKTFDRTTFTLEERFKKIGLHKTYFIRTYGCQANVRDTETIAGILEAMGFTLASSQEEADFLLFNTCAVRRSAEEHVLGEIGKLKQLKLDYPGKVFGLCGCMAQEEGVVEEIKQKYPQVDIIFGTHNLSNLPSILHEYYEQESPLIKVESTPGNIVEDLPTVRSQSFKAFINIMYGCNKFCTYCIVPYTRGRERSREKQHILDEINAFKNQGGKEIILLGQNVNAYGKDLGEEDGFTDLLRACAETGIDRIRFYTSHPRDYSSSSIDVMKEYPNIMNSLHLPVQSGSNEVLRRMARGYTVEHYKSLFDEMKEKIPSLTFTTDIIVGFPGESDEQFEETLKLAEYCKYDLAYTFIYSPREGTPAAKMEDDIPLKVKKERLQRLNELVAKYSNENNKSYLNQELIVLCEGPSKKNKKVFSGYSEENKLVNFTGEKIQAGDFVKVKITGTKSYTLDGEKII